MTDYQERNQCKTSLSLFIKRWNQSSPQTYFPRKVTLSSVMNWLILPKHFRGRRCNLPCILRRKFPSLFDSNQVLHGLSLWPGLLYATLSMDLSPLPFSFLESYCKASCVHQCRCCTSGEEGSFCFPFVNNLTTEKSESHSFTLI